MFPKERKRIVEELLAEPENEQLSLSPELFRDNDSNYGYDENLISASSVVSVGVQTTAIMDSDDLDYKRYINYFTFIRTLLPR